MKKQNLLLIPAILALIVFIASLLDSEPDTLFGSVWLFRLGWLIMAITSFMSYYRIKKTNN